MHQPIPEQRKWLRQVVCWLLRLSRRADQWRGTKRLPPPYRLLWRRTLQRRSQKAGLTWERVRQRADGWLPQPAILHPWPIQYFAASHPRWRRDARIGPVWIYAGW